MTSFVKYHSKDVRCTAEIFNNQSLELHLAYFITGLKSEMDSLKRQNLLYFQDINVYKQLLPWDRD